MQVSSPVRQGRRLARTATSEAHNAARRNRDWLIPLGRLGHAANGVVYALVGVLALQAAVGSGGETTDTYGALVHIVQAPYGQLALAVTAIGLTGYAVWRLLEAVLDTEGYGKDPKGLVQRGGSLVAAIAYAGLAVSAADLLRGQASGGEEQATQGRTSWLLSQPFGAWLVALVGLVVIGVGLGQFYLAYSGSFRDCLEKSRMSGTERQWVDRLGRWGFAARGVVFCVVGAFLVVAGSSADPSQARGLGGVLAALASQPFGPWLLGVVAVGLLSYGLFMLAEARYRRMVIA